MTFDEIVKHHKVDHITVLGEGERVAMIAFLRRREGGFMEQPPVIMDTIEQCAWVVGRALEATDAKFPGEEEEYGRTH